MTRTAHARRSPIAGCLAVIGLVTALLVAGTTATPAGAAEPPGTPYTWGGNTYGQLGDGSTTAHLTAAPVPGMDDVVDLHGGREHVVALRADGTVVVWGSNQEGQLGIGAVGGSRTSPVPVPGLSGVTMVATGHNHSMALRADGSVWTWGLNASGQLGDGSTTKRNVPVRVSGTRTYRYVAAGRDMSYAIATDGTLWGWGLNAEGQVGDGTSTNRSTPVRVGTLAGVAQVAGGRDHGLALLEDGTVWAWGSNDYGQIGDGTTTDRRSPVQVATGMTMVAAGAHHSYALRSDGQVSAWGRNYRNELGDGTSTQRTRPVTVRNVSGAVSIGSGRDHGLAVLADGSVRAWGQNTAGQLGDGTLTNRSSAVPVPGLTGVTRVAGGGAYSVALVSGGAQPVDEPPTARASASCDQLSCEFSGTASTDDGTITSYAWDFGDGGTASEPMPSHDYADAGTYDVTLTVTDDAGATGSTAIQVTVAETPPPATTAEFRAVAGSNRNAATSSVVVPAAAQVGDLLVLFVSTARTATVSTPAGWTLLGTRTDGTDLRSWAFTRGVATGTPGSTVSIGLDAMSKVDMSLVAYDGGAVTAAVSVGEPASGATHQAPAAPVSTSGSRVVQYWATKVSSTVTWTLPADLAARRTGNGSGSGVVATVTADGGPADAGTWPAHAATASVASGKAIGWTVVVAPD